MRGKGIRTDSIENPAPVERQEGGQKVSMTFKVVLRHALLMTGSVSLALLCPSGYRFLEDHCMCIAYGTTDVALYER